MARHLAQAERKQMPGAEIAAAGGFAFVDITMINGPAYRAARLNQAARDLFAPTIRGARTYGRTSSASRPSGGSAWLATVEAGREDFDG